MDAAAIDSSCSSSSRKESSRTSSQPAGSRTSVSSLPALFPIFPHTPRSRSKARPASDTTPVPDPVPVPGFCSVSVPICIPIPIPTPIPTPSIASAPAPAPASPSGSHLPDLTDTSTRATSPDSAPNQLHDCFCRPQAELMIGTIDSAKSDRSIPQNSISPSSSSAASAIQTPTSSADSPFPTPRAVRDNWYTTGSWMAAMERAMQTDNSSSPGSSPIASSGNTKRSSITNTYTLDPYEAINMRQNQTLNFGPSPMPQYPLRKTAITSAPRLLATCPTTQSNLPRFLTGNWRAKPPSGHVSFHTTSSRFMTPGPSNPTGSSQNVSGLGLMSAFPGQCPAYMSPTPAVKEDRPSAGYRTMSSLDTQLKQWPDFYAYCFDRGNGQYTRLIPADMLPPILDVPATTSDRSGMIVLEKPPGPAPNRSSNEPGRVTWGKPPPNPGSNELIQHQIDNIVNSAPPSSSQPKRAKVYCDKWVHEGVCAFTQQGCKYKHEMPFDKATQHQLGLFHGLPAWWKKHQAELARQLQDHNAGELSNQPVELSATTSRAISRGDRDEGRMAYRASAWRRGPGDGRQGDGRQGDGRQNDGRQGVQFVSPFGPIGPPGRLGAQAPSWHETGEIGAHRPSAAVKQAAHHSQRFGGNPYATVNTSDEGDGGDEGGNNHGGLLD